MKGVSKALYCIGKTKRQLIFYDIISIIEEQGLPWFYTNHFISSHNIQKIGEISKLSDLNRVVFHIKWFYIISY